MHAKGTTCASVAPGHPHGMPAPEPHRESGAFFPFRHAPSEIKGCCWNVRPKDKTGTGSYARPCPHATRGNRGEASSSCPQRGPISKLDTSDGGVPPAEPRKPPRPPKPHVQAGIINQCNFKETLYFVYLNKII